MAAFDLNKEEIQIKLTGENVRPSALSLKELSKLILTLEDALFPLIKERHKKAKLKGSLLGISSIEKGSIVLNYSVNKHGEWFQEAYQELTESVKENEILSLPFATQKAVKQYATFNSKLKAVTEFNALNGKSRNISTLTQSVKIEQQVEFKVKRTIYGTLIRLGGDKPVAEVRQFTGDKVNVEVTEKQARDLVGLLYKDVKAIGIAYLKSDGFRITSFKGQEIEEFHKTNIYDTFKFLSTPKKLPPNKGDDNS